MKIQWTVCSKQNVIPLISSHFTGLPSTFGSSVICPHCWHILIKLISMDVTGTRILASIPRCIQYISGYLYIYLLRVLRFLVSSCDIYCAYAHSPWTRGLLLSIAWIIFFLFVACAFFLFYFLWLLLLSNINDKVKSGGERTKTRKTFARSILADSYSCKWNYLRK